MKKEKNEFKKLKNKMIFGKIGSFATSVGLGLVKSTPFGHIATEIENNIKSKFGGENKIDFIRLSVWLVTTLLFVAKFMNWITFEDMGKFFEFVFKIFSVTKQN